MRRLSIIADGINSVSESLVGRGIVLTIENPKLGFIEDIDAKDIVMNCADQAELLEEIEDEIIHEYLRSHGYIYNKA